MVQYWLVLFSAIRQISNFWRIFLVFFAPVPMQSQWEGIFASPPRVWIGFRRNLTQTTYAMGQYWLVLYFTVHRFLRVLRDFDVLTWEPMLRI